MAKAYSAALPLLYVVVRLLILANWFVGAAILVLLLFMPTEQWIMSSLDLSPGAEADRIILGLRAIAVVGIICVPIYHLILTRLLSMIMTLRAGDPFVAANATRLTAIAWALVALQVLSLVVGAITLAISSDARPIDMDAGFSLSGWLAVLMTFVLARVFAVGTTMRDDLDGTI